MAYYRPLGQTFNQLNLNMYRLPDGQRGALGSTRLALAREASREDGQGRGRRDSGSSHYNPFKGIKRLYSGLRRHKSRDTSPDTTLRKYYSTPLGARDPVPGSDKLSSHSASKSKTTQTGQCVSDGEVSDSALSSETSCSTQPSSPSQHRSRSRSQSEKHVRFARSDPQVDNTYSPEEYDRRVVDPWEFMTKERRDKIREELNDYTTREMELNNVYNTNSSHYCTLCWRERCHCRALSKDIWRRARSTSMVRAGA
ncbi:hypothetical protein H4R20_002802 [Coemansia guatemalensis]|uniref:Uncharacterized protein n=1 Tax=Coemansia guatemalensis TaxID=2761395 RepID=A0A9W8HWV1_9FUNG|nr:hypothetical protein H4R20_002802 [Coemansia guatemalensis]